MKWHVVVTAPRCWERAVERIGELTLIHEVLAPTRVYTATIRGRKVERRSSWLGSLMLARWPTDDPHVWHDVSDPPDVTGILGGYPPATVSEDAIDVMLQSIHVIENTGEMITPAPCQPGDVVRFTHLAFWRIIARCVWVDKTGLVGLRIGLLGREQVIPVPWAAVETWPDGVIAPQFGRKNVKKGFTTGSG